MRSVQTTELVSSTSVLIHARLRGHAEEEPFVKPCGTDQSANVQANGEEILMLNASNVCLLQLHIF